MKLLAAVDGGKPSRSPSSPFTSLLLKPARIGIDTGSGWDDREDGESWPLIADDAGGESSGTRLLPLLRAANCAATLATSPHLTGKRPHSNSCSSPPQSLLALVDLPSTRRRNRLRIRGETPSERMASTVVKPRGPVGGRRSAASQQYGVPSIGSTKVLRQNPSRRRAFEGTAAIAPSESHGDGSAQWTADEESASVVKPTKKRGYRKATHTIRKEETERLRIELAQLEAQMAELQRRALTSSSQNEEADEEKILHTHVLRHALQQQQTAAVKIQAMMTDYAACNIQAGSPIQRFIHLGKDEQTRRDTLRALKASKIQDAQSFFSRRLSSLDPLKSMSEDYRFENEEGDYWAARFATSQFERAQSVKQIFDLVVYYLCNIEISVSEKLGHITVREDDDSGEKDINQNRLVSVTNEGLHMESNTVVFSEYREPEPGNHDGYGLIVADFVDEDERHPYRPAERVRKDVNTVMEVRSYKRRPREIGVTAVDTGETGEETVVVLTRWSHSRLRHPTFPVTKVGWYELRDSMDRWSQNMHKTIMENVIPLSEDRPIWPTEG